MVNYKLVVYGLNTQFSPPKLLQRQKRYLLQVVFKPLDSNIWNFICHIKNMVEYINHSLTFQKKQLIPENDILYPI